MPRKSIQKINETKTQFFEKTNKIDRPLFRKSRKEKKEDKSSMSGMKINDITANSIDSRRIEKYCGKLYTNKSNNSGKMDTFLERHKLLKLTEEEIGIHTLNLYFRTFP